MSDRWRGRARDGKGVAAAGAALLAGNAVSLGLVALAGAAPLALLAAASRPLDGGLLAQARHVLLGAAGLFPLWGLWQACLAALDGEGIGPVGFAPWGRLGWMGGCAALAIAAIVALARAFPPVDGAFWVESLAVAAAATLAVPFLAAAYRRRVPAHPLGGGAPFWPVWLAAAAALLVAAAGSGPIWQKVASSGLVPADGKRAAFQGDFAAAFEARVKVEPSSRPDEVRLTDRQSGAVVVVPTETLRALIATRAADEIERLFAKPSPAPPPPAPAPPSHFDLASPVLGTPGLGALAAPPLPEWMPVPSGAKVVQHEPTMDGSGGSYVLQVRRTWTETARLYERRLQEEGYAVSRNDIVGGAAMGTAFSATQGDDPAFARTLRITISKDGAGAQVQGTYQAGGGGEESAQ